MGYRLHRTTLTVLAVIFTCAVARAAEKDLLGPDEWPTTVSDTVADILRTMPEAEKRQIRQTRKDDLILFHHGWGTGIRNQYGLWRGNGALIFSACGKPCHPDDASMVIIEAVWEELQKR